MCIKSAREQLVILASIQHPAPSSPLHHILSGAETPSSRNPFSST
jgi:hypothetical protein